MVKPWTIFSCLTAVISLLLLWGCVPLEKMDRASGTIEETDYLISLAGVYEIVLKPEASDEAVMTLRLYPDGSCLFVEKTIGGISGGLLINTGRWDHSDFSEGVTLHLKGKNGVRRVMQYRRDQDNLHYSGPGYGSEGFTLIKR